MESDADPLQIVEPEHHQLKEQRLQLRQILEQQKKEQEENDRYPVLEEETLHYKLHHLSGNHEISNFNTEEVNIMQPQCQDTKSYHSNLSHFPSASPHLAPLVPVQEQLFQYNNAEEHNKLQLNLNNNLHGNLLLEEIEPTSNAASNHTRSPVPEYLNSNYNPIPSTSKDHDLTDISSNECFSDRDVTNSSQISVSDGICCENSLTTCTVFTPPTVTKSQLNSDNLILIGPETLTRPIKRQTQTFCGKREPPVNPLLNCEWDNCQAVLPDIKIFHEHINEHLKSFSK